MGAVSVWNYLPSLGRGAVSGVLLDVPAVCDRASLDIQRKAGLQAGDLVGPCLGIVSYPELLCRRAV